MDFVNKKTGEIINVEETDLASMCDGELNQSFKQEFRKLVEQMAPGDKGAISIKVKIECGYVDYAQVYLVEADINTRYPKLSISDKQTTMQDEEGRLVRPKANHLFTEIENDKAV